MSNMQSKTDKEVATLAGGCFWGLQDLLRKIPGVLGTEVGYSGGSSPDVRYEQVKTGTTGHAEVVQIYFDPQMISYEKILIEFFKMHDPTTVNQQGNDIGTQYRSAIFYHNESQKRVALQMIDRVTRSGVWGGPAVTELSPFTFFCKGEDFHQDYLEKHPDGYTCHFLRNVTF